MHYLSTALIKESLKLLYESLTNLNIQEIISNEIDESVMYESFFLAEIA